ncbi:MAG: archaellar assembly protein FlaJ [Chloroflexi bacterium]|nr:archaellar assembly protein FlaJ [Chloroflexota bacterium]
MKFLGFLPRHGKKGSSKEKSQNKDNLVVLASGKPVVQKKKTTSSKSQELLYFDLYYQLSYMAAISMSGINRDRVFEFASQLSGRAAIYFKEVETMTKHLGYDYAEACRIKGESVEDERIRNILLRMSGSMGSGESEADFLGHEADVFGTTYGDEYERKLEGLKQWTDAYSALIISAVLVVIIGVVSTMVWKTDTKFILALVGITIGILVAGSWLISLMSPKEIVPLQQPSSAEQKLVRTLTFTLLPAAVVVGLLLKASGAGLGWVMILCALVVFPIGYLSTVDDRKVSGRDRDVGAFMRSLGGVTTAIGATVTEGISKMDLRAMPALRKETQKLMVRLQTGILPSLCWKRFVLECGSTVVNRSVSMFRDAMALGANAEDAGSRASAYAVKIELLRARRRLIARPFGGLTLVMHAAVITLIVFVTEVMTKFGTMIATVEQDIPGATTSSAIGGYFSFNFEGLHLLNTLVMPVILVLTVVNALTPKVVSGGHKCKFFYNLSITMFITGMALLTVPHFAEIIFGTVGKA